MRAESGDLTLNLLVIIQATHISILIIFVIISFVIVLPIYYLHWLLTWPVGFGAAASIYQTWFNGSHLNPTTPENPKILHPTPETLQY